MFRLLFLCSLLPLICMLPCIAHAASDAEILTKADARIEKHRKGDATLILTDAAGKPVAGAEITIEQTSHAFLFGCNIFCWGDEADRYRKGLPKELQETYRTRFAALFNFATLPIYWNYYEPEKGKPRHDYLSALAGWCRQNNIATKGHPLAYNFIDPTWIPKDPGELRTLQIARVEDLVSRFAGKIDCWDVINELTEPSVQKAKAPLQTAMWNADRIALAKACFSAARKANPKATLLINDYRTGADYERTLTALVDENGNPIFDVLGVQSHQHDKAWPVGKTWDVCERFARFGKPLHFTETTLLSGGSKPAADGAWPSTPEGEALQATRLAEFYTVLFSHPAVEAITYWDLIDGYTWKGAPAGLLRKDGTPKPAYEALHKLIRQTWWTKTVAKTDARGRATVRGFLGSYRVTARKNGAVVAEASFVLGKAENTWAVKTR